MFKCIYNYAFIVLAIPVYYLLVRGYYETRLDEVLILLLLSVLYISLVVYGLFRLIKDERPIPFRIKATPLLTGFVLLFSFPITFYLINKDGGKKVAIHAGHYSDLNAISLDLRTDNTFKLLHSGPFGGKYYRGKYLLGEDTLRIYNDSLKSLYPTGTFAITTDSLQRRFFEYIPENKEEHVIAFYLKLEIKNTLIR